MPPIEFVDATKEQLFARIALDGPGGAGKTFTALQIATLLGGTIGVADSEHGSAKHYSNRFKFKHSNLPNHSLNTYIESVAAAARAGFATFITDSMSHAWNGKGGALEQVDKAGGNKFANGWKTVSPLLARYIDALLDFPGHVICTMRVKTAYEVVDDDRGRKVPKKVGLAPIMRDGVEYEFDLVLDLAHDGTLTVSKSRCEEIPVGHVYERSEIPTIVAKLKVWLTDGEPVSEATRLTRSIRSATNEPALVDLAPKIKALSTTDLEGARACLAEYKARKLAFQTGEAAPVGDSEFPE